MNGTADQLAFLQPNASCGAAAVVDHITNLTDPTTAVANASAAMASVMGAAPLSSIVTAFEPMVSNGYIQNSINFLFLGTILETGRRLWQWIMDRFTGGFVLTAIFDSCDPAYEWFFAYLNDEKIWSTTREFHVSAKTNSRTWGVKSGDEDDKCAQYLPTYDKPQLFRFKQTWCQVSRQKSGTTHNYEHEEGGQLILTLYTRKRAVLDDLIQTARERFMANAKKARLVVHGSCSCGSFCQTTTKARRALDSLILPTGVKETLVNDARDFLRSEAWYAEAGIQHKRGYLLYGPPGTGKSSTVHALAGELDLEIFSLSLATNGLDDAGLSRLVSSTPAHSIILIEDIDCAFPSREEKERKKEAAEKGIIIAETRSTITLSGLLNVIDGCSSEEGRLLFATTNYVNRLDPALLRAGRMDVKIHYKMSTRDQILALFKRFYPASPISEPASAVALITDTTTGEKVEETEMMEADEKASIKKSRRISDLALTPPLTPLTSTIPTPTVTASGSPTIAPTPAAPLPTDDKFTMDTTPIYPPRLPKQEIETLATRFADAVPPNVYTVAELQGYLLTLKTQPYKAVEGVHAWMKEMEEERERLKRREEEEQAREKEEREKKEKEKQAALYPTPTPPLSSLSALSKAFAVPEMTSLPPATLLPAPETAILPPPTSLPAPETTATAAVADAPSVPLPSPPAKEEKAVGTEGTTL
ncbi:hypothetical protein FRB96_006905 [Tulasnella sp. 330]|nr:hypothetical protein FRB96_006905 [Tulasnella sp. 330]KAG8871233.1 hypothetical protein FRB97_008881 [Tulasnella sp. 331]KAG8889341.1 hypothetical protein FRB98_004625 [Tulasnella sp. 332]